MEWQVKRHCTSSSIIVALSRETHILSTVIPSVSKDLSLSSMLIFLGSMKNPFGTEGRHAASVPLCVQCCPPNVFCLLECVGVAVSDLCAHIEVT